jgi:hypothetical protein
VYIQDINKMEKEKMVFMFKMSHHEKIMSFKLVIPYGNHGYMTMHRRRSSPAVDYGAAIRNTSSIKNNQKGVFHLVRSRSSSYRSSGMHKIKVCFLTEFLSYRSGSVAGI